MLAGTEGDGGGGSGGSHREERTGVRRDAVREDSLVQSQPVVVQRLADIFLPLVKYILY